MEISWLGHSCFRIRGSHGIVITDPYPPETGYLLGKPTARVVTVSHQHPDHNYTQGIGNEFKIISRPGEYEVSDVMIIGITTFHDAEQGKLRGKNTVFLITIDDISICHLGDLGHTLSSQQKEQLGHIDVLLVPIGGDSTINASTAIEVMRQLEPKIVIPMHYKTPVVNNDRLETVERFIREMGLTNAQVQPKLTISRSSMPETTQVVVLEYPQQAPPAAA
jgi:L-ascorbate metabolism protein UlaG (beta-lactamase superfamily)